MVIYKGETKVHQTDYIKCTLDPDWPAFELPLESLSGGELRFEVFDWERIGTNELIGKFTVSTRRCNKEHELLYFSRKS